MADASAELDELLHETGLGHLIERIEGFAWYLEKDFVEPRYGAALMPPHVPLLRRAWLLAERSMALLRPTFDEVVADDLRCLQSCYARGIQHYRQRQLGRRPVRFRA